MISAVLAVSIDNGNSKNAYTMYKNTHTVHTH